MQKYLLATVFLSIILACSNDSILEGISENSNRDTKIEDAAISLDRGDYDSVISELSSIYSTASINAEVGRLLASGYMGKSGIDLTLSMLNMSDESTLDPFDVLSSMISSEYVSLNEDERYLDGNAIDGITSTGEETYEIDLLMNITSAKETLQLLSESGMATIDDVIQLGIASTAHFIMNMGNQTAIALNTSLDSSKPENRVYGQVPVPINKAAYEYYGSSKTTEKSYDWKRIDAGDFIDTTTDSFLTTYQEDLYNIHNAILAFKNSFLKSNELENTLDSFLRSALGASTDQEISDELILEYRSDGIYEFVNRLATP